MSSSFPATRFPDLSLRKTKEVPESAYPVYKDTNGAGPAGVPSDEILLSKISHGDREALGFLFRRHACLIHSIGKKILRDPGEAEDFVQEFFLHIFKKAHLYNESKGPARGWIVQTSYYQALRRRAHLSTRPHYGSAELDELETG